MLAKFSLPPKPSLKGNDWVVDASHCQECQSQFSLILVRKHHCQRCGGLFCQNCTQDKMKLRGQGDSPVRICKLCKKTVEESHFNSRQRRTRKGGSSKLEAKNEDELLQDLIGDGMHSLKSVSAVNDLQGDRDVMTSSSMQVPRTTDIVGSISSGVRSNSLDGVGFHSPEELYKLAQEEKSRFRTLNGQGKTKEARLAFKRGNELERQAKAIELALRKNRRIASSQKGRRVMEDDELISSKKEIPSRTSKPRKDDIGAELRELCLTNDDLHEVEKKPAKQSIEKELHGLFDEIHSEKKGVVVDKTPVFAHKKKALQLKREGKAAEAKEELRKAKILEKQLEEQELLAQDEESDDEISSLIRSMENDKGVLPSDDVAEHSLNFNLASLADESTLEGNLMVTDDDMKDPELASVLVSFGWREEDTPSDKDTPETACGKSCEKLAAEVLALKMEALKHKRAGNLDMARDILKKAKLLEKDLSTKDADPAFMQKTSISQFPQKLHPTDADDNAARTSPSHKIPPKSRSVIQKELLALKRKALGLKREGRLDEAEEELRKGKALELQLEEMDKVPVLPSNGLSRKTLQPAHPHQGAFMAFDLDEGGDQDLTDQDLKDPALLSALKNLGWKEDSKAGDGVMKSSESGEQCTNAKNSQAMYPHHDVFTTSDLAEVDNTEVTDKDMQDPALLSVLENLGWREDSKDVNLSVKTSDSAPSQSKRTASADTTVSVKPARSKGEIQRELLAIKRKALALRRQGNAEEAEEQQMKAGDLEKELKELEAKQQKFQFGYDSVSVGNQNSKGGAEVKYRPNHFEKEKLGAGSSLHTESSIMDIETPKRNLRDQNDVVPSLPTNVDPPNKDGAVNTEGEPDKLKSLFEPPETAHSQNPPNKDGAVNTEGEPDKLKSLFEPPETAHSQNPANTLDLLTGDLDSSGVAAGSLSGQNLNPVGFDERDEQAFPPNKPGRDLRPGDLTLDDARPPNTHYGERNMGQSHERDSVQSAGYAVHDRSPNVVVSQDKGNEILAAKEIPDDNAPPAVDSLKHQILAHKRRALALRREGNRAQAIEELKQAKLLERTMEVGTKKDDDDSKKEHQSTSLDTEPSTKDNQQSNAPSPPDVPVVQKVTQEGSTIPAQKPASSRNRFKLQQECLSKKRQAMKLRREGKLDEAELILAEAQKLQAQIDEIDGSTANASATKVEEDASVEDFLDPELRSVLNSLGVGVSVNEPEVSTGTINRNPKKAPATSNHNEKVSLEQIKAEKLRALNLKRAGKQAEALEVLRSVKLLERKLASQG